MLLKVVSKIICNRCKEELPFTDKYFPRNKSSKDGFEKTCKQCRLERRLKRSFPCIYEIYCQSENRYYIGQTIKPINDRISKHFSDAKSGREQPLYVSIRNNKYNRDLYSVRVIERLEDKNLLDEKEIYWIDNYIKEGRLLYNVELGGRKGCIVSQETREKQSISQSKREYNSFYLIDINTEKIVGKYSTIKSCERDNKLNSIGDILIKNILYTKNYTAMFESEYSDTALRDLLNDIQVWKDNVKMRSKGEKNGMYGRTGANNPNSKKVKVIDKGVELIFDSITEAENHYGVTNLRYYARGGCNNYYKKKDIYLYLIDKRN